VTKNHSDTWSGPRSIARIPSQRKCSENSTGTYATHAVSKTTVGAAVYVLKSATRDTLLLTARELTSSVTAEIQADASALIGNNSLFNNNQKNLRSSMIESVLTKNMNQFSDNLTLVNAIPLSACTHHSQFHKPMAFWVDQTLLNICHTGSRMNFQVKLIMTLKSFSGDSNKDLKKEITLLKMTYILETVDSVLALRK
jgi:hypothetical protein